MKPGLDKAELSSSISPTQDLFRHVNGSWLDNTEIPEDKAVYGSFYLLADDSEPKLHQITTRLSGASHIGSDSLVLKVSWKISRFFTT